jgi:hypothetical protein
MNDGGSGTIIVKGINQIVYDNNQKILYPNNKLIPKTTTMKFNHLIEVNIKEGRYRVVYKIVSLVIDPDGLYPQFFNCINFEGTNEDAIQSYMEQFKVNLKNISAKKRDPFLLSVEPQLIDINSKLKTSIEFTMKSIRESIGDSKGDEW